MKVPESDEPWGSGLSPNFIFIYLSDGTISLVVISKVSKEQDSVISERLCDFQMPVDIAPFSAFGNHKGSELPHNGKRYVLYVLRVGLFLAKAQKEIEIIPIAPNCLRSKLPNLNLSVILFCRRADFHCVSSFCMSHLEGKRMSQRNRCMSQFDF